MSWYGYEKRKAKERKGIHVGGSGAPDYIRGDTHGEVKAWSRRMGKTAVRNEVLKGRNEIVSKSGFTDEAITYAERYRPDLRLIHSNTVVKPRRREKSSKSSLGDLLILGFGALFILSLLGNNQKPQSNKSYMY